MTLLAAWRRWEAGTPPVWRAVTFLFTGAAAIVYFELASSTGHYIAAHIADGTFYAQSDFGVATWTAGRLLRGPGIATLYAQNWRYPPTMAVLAMPASLLPLAPAFWAWRIGTFLISACLLRLAGLGWWVIILGLCGPAAFYDMTLGQNGVLTAGLLVSALLLAARRPMSGGVLAGLLSIKPQIAILVPVILLGPAHRRALLACALTILVMLALSVWLTGWRSWALFVSIAQPKARAEIIVPFGQAFQISATTTFMLARSLCAGLRIAAACQAMSTIAAAMAAWRLWTLRGVLPVPRMAATVCLSMLAVPYGYSYDFVSFSVAAMALLAAAGPRARLVLGLLWLWAGLTRLVTLELHVVTMPLAALIGVALAWRQLRPAPGQVFDPIHPIL